MLFSLIGNGVRPAAGDAAARRLRRIAFHADRAFARAAARCERTLRNWGARRLAREMQSWPDERLKDIGLTRAELASAIEGVRRPYRWVPDHDARALDPSRFGH